MVFAISLIFLSFLFFPCVCKSVLHNSLHQYFISFIACTVGHQFSHMSLGYSAKSSINTFSLNEKQKLRSPMPFTSDFLWHLHPLFQNENYWLSFWNIKERSETPCLQLSACPSNKPISSNKIAGDTHQLSKQMVTVRYVHESRILQDPKEFVGLKCKLWR